MPRPTTGATLTRYTGVPAIAVPGGALFVDHSITPLFVTASNGDISVYRDT